jgi:hypothetical protein
MSENQTKEILKQLANHERRILILEGISIVKTDRTTKGSTMKTADYSGPTGGVRYLISNKFFKEKRDLAVVRGRLAQENYYYSRQAVHEALKALSKSSGPLVALKEGRHKTYVERK